MLAIKHRKEIVYFGENCVLACDGNCEKAWGINGREKKQLGKDEDDYEYLADDELGTAPPDPGTYEGGLGKPKPDEEKLNKWCARECERSEIVDTGEEIDLPDFSKRRKNMKGEK